jgi:hypothetical protein
MHPYIHTHTHTHIGEVGGIVGAVVASCRGVSSGVGGMGGSGGRVGSSGAALRCASVLVESLVQLRTKGGGMGGDPAQAEAERQALLVMVLTITDIYCLSPTYSQLQVPPSPEAADTCMRLFGPSYEAMEAYFSLLHTYLLLCR